MPPEDSVFSFPFINIARQLATISTASCLETTAIHPLDTLTKRIQDNPKPIYSSHRTFSTNRTAFCQVLFADTANQPLSYKFASLYRGLPPALVYRFLQRLSLTTQKSLKEKMEHHFQTQSYWIDLGSSVITGGSEAFFLLPFDYYRVWNQTRKTAQANEKNPKSCFTAFGPTLVRNTVFMTTMSITTEKAKHYLIKNSIFSFPTAGPQAEPNDTQKHVARAFGFATGTFFSSPADVVKVRLQAKRTVPIPTAVQLTQEMLQNEGPSAFLKGVIPKTLSQSARLTFFFGAHEYLQKRWFNESKPAVSSTPSPKPA